MLTNVRSFYTTRDGALTYPGVRGFGLLGDYNARFLVMVNGHRMTDIVYGAMYLFGQEFPLDMSLVEQIEIVRGPSSALKRGGGEQYMRVACGRECSGNGGLPIANEPASAAVETGGTDAGDFVTMLIVAKTPLLPYHTRGRDVVLPELGTPAPVARNIGTKKTDTALGSHHGGSRTQTRASESPI